jgi:formimidoylglutamate deiminase
LLRRTWGGGELNRAQVLEADLTWTGAAFESGVQVRVDAEGRIVEVGRTEHRTTQRLRDRALLPGFVNAHSHAFQRGLRGRGESFPAGAGDFWSWRDAMYQLVEGLDASTFFRLTLQAFREMRSAGITTVGEFHYVHHDVIETAEGGDFALDEVVLRAASRAGLRLAMLETYYETGAIRQPLQGAQRRFRTATPELYWSRLDRLQELLQPKTQSLGAVVHSVRAAGPDEIHSLYEEARRRGLVFHLHLEEQRQEVADCRAAYGKTPMALVLDTLGTAEGVVAVHCTQTVPADMTRFFALGGRICLCPTTEGNLGDGIADLGPARGHLDKLCLGSDSNLRISMLEEARWLEFAQRLRSGGRGILRDGAGSLAPGLLQAASAGGADALGVAAGRIVAGAWADFAVVDLNATSLALSSSDSLAEALVFGCGEEVIVATAVGGQWAEHRGAASEA